MTTLTHSASQRIVAFPVRLIPFALRKHHPLTTSTLVFGSWLIAAALVYGAHGLSPTIAAVATISTILGIAFLYTFFAAREAGVSHALSVGTAWLVMSIAVEMIITTRLGHGWFSLIGNPHQPLLRNVVMFLWIFAPSFFARRR